MQTKTVNLLIADIHVINYLIAKTQGHESRCAWMVEKGWDEWQSYEKAWGNPIPDYCQDPAYGWPIITKEKVHIGPKMVGGTFYGQWNAIRLAWDGDEYVNLDGENALKTAMRCFAISRYGVLTEVPDKLVRE